MKMALISSAAAKPRRTKISPLPILLREPGAYITSKCNAKRKDAQYMILIYVKLNHREELLHNRNLAILTLGLSEILLLCSISTFVRQLGL